jgi:DNA-binding NarL/FixJ family response regulator
MAVATASDWALGLEARSRALLTDGGEAEHFYREAIEHLGRTWMRAELPAPHLLYGEWLRIFSSQSELTAQEAQVAKLARDGLSNPEIGARLSISSRTVKYHLSKVFTNLNITSRIQLGGVLT